MDSSISAKGSIRFSQAGASFAANEFMRFLASVSTFLSVSMLLFGFNVSKEGSWLAIGFMMQNVAVKP
jgi:hypothetical protein